MVRFLFLDDNPRRHRHFSMMTIGCDVTHVWTVEECMKVLLGSEPFDCAFLDHDLAGGVFVEEVKGSGTEVANFVRDSLPDERLPKQVIVHSWNPVGAERMRAAIAERGIPVKKIPFAFLDDKVKKDEG